MQEAAGQPVFRTVLIGCADIGIEPALWQPLTQFLEIAYAMLLNRMDQHNIWLKRNNQIRKTVYPAQLLPQKPVTKVDTHDADTVFKRSIPCRNHDDLSILPCRRVSKDQRRMSRL